MKNLTRVIASVLACVSLAVFCSCNGQRAIDKDSNNNIVVKDTLPTDVETTQQNDIQTTPEQEKPEEKSEEEPDETPTDDEDNIFEFGNGNKLDFAPTSMPIEHQYKYLYSFAEHLPKSKLFDEEKNIWGARIDTAYIGDFNDDGVLDMLVGYIVDYDKHTPKSQNPKYYDMIDFYTFNAGEIQLAREIVCDREQNIEWSVKYNNLENKAYVCDTKYLYTQANRKKINFYDFFADENKEVASFEEFNEQKQYTLDSKECSENEYLEKSLEYSNFYITQSGGEFLNKAVYFTKEKIEVHQINFVDNPQD